MNACAERFVLSIKSECLERIVPLGEQHLRRAVSEFMSHCREERHRQGLEGQLIASDGAAGRGEGRVVRRERLGGLLSDYYQAAAQDAVHVVVTVEVSGS